MSPLKHIPLESTQGVSLVLLLTCSGGTLCPVVCGLKLFGSESSVYWSLVRPPSVMLG